MEERSLFVAEPASVQPGGVTPTPLTAFALAEILAEAGLPEGALTVAPTSRPGEVADALLGHDPVRKLSFTGSTGVGHLLLRRAADRVVNCSMELGGNAPFVVCDDADVDTAVGGALVAKLRNAGQACTAANRFLVHSAVADRFAEALASAFADHRIGPPADPANDIGPLINQRAVQRITTLVDQAIAGGARLVREPTPVPEKGSYLAPQILMDVSPTAAIATEEIFGPVAPIVTWTDDQDLLRIANDTEFGLAGYVFSADTQRATALARNLQCGMVGVNRGVVSDPAAPFGGMKQSGIGREGAREGIRAYQETQFLSLA